MNGHIIIFILALVGIAESLYLNYERKRKRPPVCVIGNDCGKVWESSYSKTFGLSNEILGLIYFATVAVIELSLFSDIISSSIVIGEDLVLFSGAIMSSYFIYIQWRIIKAWCFWCSLSGIIVLAMILTRFFL